jgi:hypothetical protein
MKTIKVKAKDGHIYSRNKKNVCKRCLGQMVVFIPNLHNKDLGYWVPCKCLKKVL